MRRRCRTCGKNNVYDDKLTRPLCKECLSFHNDSIEFAKRQQARARRVKPTKLAPIEAERLIEEWKKW